MLCTGPQELMRHGSFLTDLLHTTDLLRLDAFPEKAKSCR